MRVERDGSITGIPKPFSVDRNDMAYRELREAMNERRVALPRYELLRREMRQLESTSPGKAPDHAVGGTKDSSDATAGVVGYLSAFGHAVLSDPINGRVFGRKELGLEPVDDFLLVEDEMDWGFDPMGTSTGGTLRLGVE